MATIGNVVISVFASHKGLTKSLTSAQKKVKKFASSAVKTLRNIGAAVVAGVSAAVGAGIAVLNRYAERIDNLAKTSSKIGTTVADLQKLQYQAELTGVGSETLNTALQRMVRRISEVGATGKGAAVDALKELNLNAKELSKLSPDEQFYEIARAMQAISGQGDKVRLAMKIFDTEGVALVNTMNGNLEQMGAEFDALGIKITQSQAAMVESYNDSKTKLGAIFSGFGIQLTTQLAEPFTKLIEFINLTIQKMGGMQSAAKGFANFMLKAIKVAITGVQKLLDAFLQIENIMLKIEKIKLAPGILKDFADAATKDDAGYIGPSTQKAYDIDAQIAKNNAKIADSSTLKSIDGLIKTLEEGISNKIEEGELIKPEHHAAFQQAANDASVRASADKKAAEKTIQLANAAGKAAEALAPETKKAEAVTSLASSFSPIGGLNSGLSGVSTSKTASNVVGIDSAKNAVKNNTQSLGKVNINLQTDYGKVAGEIFAEPAFISGLKSFTEKQTNKETRMAAL